MVQRKDAFFPSDTKRPGDFPYTPAVGVGDTVYISGQGPIDPATGRIAGDTIEAQVELTLSNVRRVLAAAGCAMEDCVKVTAYLADIADFDRYNAVYRKHFAAEPRPARTTVQARLWGGILVEIDAIAVRGAGGGSLRTTKVGDRPD